MNKVVSGVKTIVLFCITVMVGSFLASGIVTGIPSVFGYRIFLIMSESMEPTIMKGQVVVGKALGKDDMPEIGEIVAYHKGDGILKRMVIHRVVGVDADGIYILWGDNNYEPDPPVSREQIVYRILVWE